MKDRNPFDLGVATETDPHRELDGLARRSSTPPSGAGPASRRFSRYQLIRPLGTGGMGVVFQGRDLELHRDVAIKLVRAVGKDPAEAQARLRREAQTMAALSHPNLVAVHDIGDLGDRVFIAMELVRGGTLRDLVGDRRDWREQLRVLIAAGRGLAAAHAAGVIHRDFKPDNVLLGEQDRVVVADFGLARSFDPLPEEVAETSTETCSMLGGTLAYMPPERIAGESGDPRVDQFAWCVTAFEVLEGYRPFDVSRPGSAAPRLGLHAERLPWSRRELPLHIRATIDRGLALDRNARWPSMEALLAALEAPRARRRLYRLPAAALLAIAVALGLWLLLPRARAPGSTAPSTAISGAASTTSPWAPTLLARESGNHPAHFSAIDDTATTLAFASRGAVWTQQRASGARKDLLVPRDLVIESIRFGRGSSLLLTGRSGASWVTYLIDIQRNTARRLLTLPAAHVVDVSRDGRYLIASTDEPAWPTDASLIGPILVALADDATSIPSQLIARNLGQCVWSPSGDSIACISASSDESQAVLLDVATRREKTLARFPSPYALHRLRWTHADQMIIVERQHLALGAGVSVVQRWALKGDTLLSRHALYVTPAYDVITNLEIVNDELFYATVNERWRSGIVPLGGSSSPQLQPLDTGSLSDATAIGWTSTGEVILTVNRDGRLRTIRMVPGGSPKLVENVLPSEPPPGGRPVVILKDILYKTIRRYETPICAADYAEPCLVVTRRDGANDIFQRWRPASGATGPELLVLPHAANWTLPALSKNGRLAVIRDDGIDLYDEKGRQIRELSTRHSYQAVAWNQQNQLFALRQLGTQSELVRLDERGGDTSLFKHSTFNFLQLKLSLEGTRALVVYIDNAVEHWSVNL